MSTSSAEGGAVVWLTGLSGSGKTTLALALADRLRAAGRTVCVLDGDILRQGLNRDLGFSPEDRHENIRRTAEVARLVAAADAVAVVALISPYAADRAAARRIAAPLPFLEVHVHADLAVCEARDPKGLYRRARAGLLPGFTGIDAPYEAPEAPEVRFDTNATKLDAAVGALMSELAFPKTARRGLNI